MTKSVAEAIEEKYGIVKDGKTIEEAYAMLNPLTNTWHIQGQKENPVPYLAETKSRAACMCMTINHFNKTNEIKKFSGQTKFFKRLKDVT